MKSIDTALKGILESPRRRWLKVDRLMDLTEAAEVLCIARKTLWKWIAEGKFPAVRIGRLWKVKESDIEAYVEARTTKVDRP